MVVFTGRTVEEAISKGLDELGLTRLKAHIKVISREKKGFLGFGKKPAQVDIEALDLADKKAVQAEPVSRNKVTSITERLNHKQESQTLVDTSDEPQVSLSEKVQSTNSGTAATNLKNDDFTDRTKFVVADTSDPVEKRSVPSDQVEQSSSRSVGVDTKVSDTDNQASSAPTLHQAQEKASQSSIESAPAIDIEEAAKEVTAYVDKIIYEMDLEASIETTTKRRQINLQIETPEPGRIIGYHGKVLKSLQLLAQNFLYDRYSKVFTVSVNVHDYVQHRTETLIDFSQKIASRVLESGQDFVMDPMSNSERKIVHKAISHIAGVESYSQGSDPNRYVVVTPSQK